MGKKRIAIVTNLAWPFYNFRRTLADRLTSMGHEVIAVAQADGTEYKISEANIHYIPLKHLHSTGTDPLRDFKLFQEFQSIFKTEKIDFVFLYNAKPMIYGGLAATLQSIPYVSTVAGLGNPFTESGSITRILMMILFKVSMWRAHRVFFHNREHRELFVKWGIASKRRTDTVAGSGVDMDRFPCALLEKSQEPFTFLMFSRLLVSKGARLYAEASRILKKEFPSTRFLMLGPTEPNKYSITESELQEWIAEGSLEYLGETDEVQKYISQSHVVVYPSYYAEGTPRALLEAASMCKSLITTDNVGCHDVVREGENGHLVPMKDLEGLIAAMRQMIVIDNEDYSRMARSSRSMIADYYDKRFVIQKYIEAFESLSWSS